MSCSKDTGHTQLHKACDKGDVTEVMRLVNVDDHMINAQNNGGNTPLHLACQFGHSDIVKTLMLAGADETITENFLWTPARVAEAYGHPELLKLLDRQTLWAEMQTNKLIKLTSFCDVAIQTDEVKVDFKKLVSSFFSCLYCVDNQTSHTKTSQI